MPMPRSNPMDDRLWLHFVRWCGSRRLRALPAHPWTVAAYLRWCAPRRSATPPARRLRAIARAHVLSLQPPPDRAPLVRRTLRLIEQRGVLPPVRGGRRTAEPRPDDLPFAPPEEAAETTGAPSARRRALRHSPPLVRRG